MSEDQESITSELESISFGSYWFLLGWAFEYMAGFFTQIVLTNSLSTASYGVYAFIRKLIAVVVGLSSGGSKMALNRFLPKYSDESSIQDGVLGLSFTFSVVGSLFLGIIVYVSAPFLSALTFTGELTVGIVRVVALTFPLISAVKILSGAFRALELARLSILVDWVLRPGVLLIIVGGVALFNPSLWNVVAALVVASVATLVVSTTLFVVYTEHAPSLGVSLSVVTDFFKYSLPLVLSQSSALLFRRIDIFMLSYLFASTDVAVYNVALLLSGTLLLPLSGFSQLFPPIASRMYEQSSMHQLNELYSTVTRWSVMLTSAGFVGLVVYRTELLAIFGPDYTAGTGILVILAFGQLVNSAVGPAGHLLGMTDHQYVVLANRTAMSVANVLLNYLLLTRYGVIGAAVATALVFASLNVARVVEVYVLEEMFPYDRSFLKFFPALGVATVVMYSIRSLLITPLSYVGIPLGLAVYVLSLYGFGMQQVDRNLLTQIITRVVDSVKP